MEWYKNIFVWLLCLFLLIQLYYYLYYFLRLALYKNKNTTKNNIPFSIIVCAKNEEANLRKNISLLLHQEYYNVSGLPNFEVVLVDDNSEDGTFFLLNEIKNIYEHLTVVSLQQEARHIMGKKFPLAMGIKSAKYDNLLLIDADCRPASLQWLQQIANKYTSNVDIVLGYGAYKKDNTWLNKLIRWETVHTAMQYLSYSLAGNTYMGVGRNLSYKRELFNNNKGFSKHVNLASGDDDLFINEVATNKNVEICISPEAFTFSQAKETKEQWKRQKERHLSTGRFYKAKHKFALGLYSFSHIAFYIALILCIILTPFWYLACIAFAVRGLVQFFIFDKILIKLHEQDLNHLIFYFDLYQIAYYFKMFPAIFKKPMKWK